jgi:hypothetical protein
LLSAGLAPAASPQNSSSGSWTSLRPPVHHASPSASCCRPPRAARRGRRVLLQRTASTGMPWAAGGRRLRALGVSRAALALARGKTGPRPPFHAGARGPEACA